MFNIGGFFNRFSSMYAKEVGIRTLVAEVCTRHVPALKVDPKDISIKNGTISIKNLSSSAKMALFVKKTNIIDDLKSTDIAGHISSIKF